MNRFYRIVTAVSFSLLAGACVSPDSGKANLEQQAVAERVPANSQPLVAAAPVQNAEPAVQPLENPVTIPFDAKSTQMDDQQRALIERIVAQAGNASQIILTGMCDRAAADNAREVAIARAASVRDALRAAGSTVKNVRIKYRTAQSAHGVLVSWVE